MTSLANLLGKAIDNIASVKHMPTDTQPPLKQVAPPLDQTSFNCGSLPSRARHSPPSMLRLSSPMESQGAWRVGRLSLGCNRAAIIVRAEFDQHKVPNYVDANERIQTLVYSEDCLQQKVAIVIEEDGLHTGSDLADNLHCFSHEIKPLSRTHRPSPSTPLSDQESDFVSFDQQKGSPTPKSQFRPLTSILDVYPFTMTTIVSNPGSPPDLSGSRSSKSSSYCSTSHYSTPDGIASDITNFEEIGLDDEKYGPQEKSQVGSSKTQNVANPTPSTQNRNMTTSEKRPALPNLQSQVRAAVQQQEKGISYRPGLAKTGSARRGFTTPASSFPLAQQIHGRPRSSSPPHRPSVPTSALSANSLHPSATSSTSSSPITIRRTSWQSRRKSIQELEAEYHDSDDDLPEDASLWNVPVSPFPSGNHSRRSSYRGSPERSLAALSPRPIPLAHSITAPEVPERPSSFSQPLPKMRHSPRSTSICVPSSNPSSPRSRMFLRNGRAKSWNLAMSDLSEEARIISQTLEYHAERANRDKSENLQNSLPDTDAKFLSGRTSSMIQLPPVQKGNLDFMPISKEKEAILSRTRPSWLPPKDPKEERRHLKEYQRMMAASIDAEKKKQSKSEMQQCEKDDTRDALNRIWQYYIAETTDLTTIDKRVYELCWRGINPNVRGKVWQRGVGNPLGLTLRTYEKALERAKEIQRQPRDQLTNLEKMMVNWFVDIERDAETAFPELNIFQRNGPQWQDLVDLCEAYACYRSDIGYFYGMQLIAGLILLQAHTPAEAFILMANCLNRPIPLAFHTGDLATISRTYNHIISILAVKFPRLHEYLFGSIEEGGLGFTAEEVLEPMFRTIFSNGLDLDRLCRVWDIWIIEGDRTIVRSAVAILGSLQPQLFDVRGDIDLKRRNIQEMIGWGPFNRDGQGSHWNMQAAGDEEKFVEEIRLAGILDYTGR